MQKLRLLLVDDHPIVSLGMETLLKEAGEFEWLGAAATPADALAQVERLQPDLIVLDLILGGGNGLNLISDILKEAPQVCIVVYSGLEEKVYAHRCLEAGAMGYVVKEAGYLALLAALRSVAAGEPYASDFVKQSLLRKAIGRRACASLSGVESLSNQEVSVFHLLGSGLSSAEVAGRLGIGVKTVSAYRERIKNKLGLQNARELERGAEAFFREKLIESVKKKRSAPRESDSAECDCKE